MIRFTNSAYDVLKPIALIWIPAVGTLYAAIAAIWGIGDVTSVELTLSAVDAFLGTALHLSSNPTTSKSEPEGQLVISKTETGQGVYLVLEKELEELAANKTITLTVTPKS